MSADADLCPPAATPARLGDRAHPAGRPPVARYVFAAVTLDRLEDARLELTADLERIVGPLRCTEVAVEVATGLDAVAELLADLNIARGQSTATLAPVAAAVRHVAAAAARLGLGEPALVVASCGALTRQSHLAVWAC